MCIFQEKGEPVKCIPAEKWKNVEKIDGEWKGDTAAGSGMPGALSNPKFSLKIEK